MNQSINNRVIKLFNFIKQQSELKVIEGITNCAPSYNKLLISFNLTSESVKCAIEIQKAIQNLEYLNLRIGIHEGEIAISGDDVLGDDVNVAARIEPFSAVGGVSISGKVQQNISSIPDIKTELIAKPNLKGVNQEISVYAIISNNLPFPDKSLITSNAACLAILLISF